MKTIAFLNRVVRRANRAQGYDDEQLPSYWHYVIEIGGEEHSGKVIAQTRSEARARIKAALGIGRRKRLPVGAQIEKGELCHA